MHMAKTPIAHGKGHVHGKDPKGTRQSRSARQRKTKKFAKNLAPTGRSGSRTRDERSEERRVGKEC